MGGHWWCRSVMVGVSGRPAREERLGTANERWQTVCCQRRRGEAAGNIWGARCIEDSREEARRGGRAEESSLGGGRQGRRRSACAEVMCVFAEARCSRRTIARARVLSFPLLDSALCSHYAMGPEHLYLFRWTCRAIRQAMLLFAPSMHAASRIAKKVFNLGQPKPRPVSVSAAAGWKLLIGGAARLIDRPALAQLGR